jgi:hypothetical protein
MELKVLLHGNRALAVILEPYSEVSFNSSMSPITGAVFADYDTLRALLAGFMIVLRQIQSRWFTCAASQQGPRYSEQSA